MQQIQIEYNKRLDDAQDKGLKRRNELFLIRGTWAAGIAGGLLFLMEIVKFVYALSNPSH